MKYKYNGSDERVFPTISLTVEAGDTFDAPDDFSAPDVSPTTITPKPVEAETKESE